MEIKYINAKDLPKEIKGKLADLHKVTEEEMRTLRNGVSENSEILIIDPALEPLSLIHI